MPTQWYIAKNGERLGPYTGEQLQDRADAGKLGPRDMVWCEGMPDWVPAKNVLQQFTDELPPRRKRRREEEDAYEAPRQRGQFPGKLVAPGFFLLAIFMFLLPWVDVRCNGFTAVTQSGFQACSGDYTESLMVAQQRLRNEGGFRLNADQVKPAPLLWFYGLLLLIGLILGLALPVGTPRLVGVALCGVLGFALAVMQMSVGFPITEQVARANADPIVRRQIQQQPLPFPQAMFVPGQGGRDLIWVSMTPWFWFGALLTLGVTVGLALEHGVIFAERKT